MSDRTGSSLLTALVAAVVLSAPAVAMADEVALTPEGPATVAGVWTGASTMEGRPPQVVVGWTVTVGPGGQAGPVRLQAITSRAPYRVVGGGPVEQLPAVPGTYAFAIPAGKALRIGDYRDVSLAVAQEAGRHAILVRPTPTPELGPMADLAQLWHADVFTPALADDAQDVKPSQTLAGTKLAVTMVEEADVDQDGLGDETQDVGDLKLVSARVARRKGQDDVVVAHVRNTGSTVRDRVTIATDRLDGWGCDGRCVKAIAPGQEADLSMRVSARAGAPATLTVRAEGPDLTPADNTLPLAPRLTLAKPANGAAVPGAGAIRVRVGLGRGGTVKVTARVAGLRFGRAFRFSHGQERTLVVAPRSAADRRRLARALRRPGRLVAVVTADAGGGARTLRLKL